MILCFLPSFSMRQGLIVAIRIPNEEMPSFWLSVSNVEDMDTPEEARLKHSGKTNIKDFRSLSEDYSFFEGRSELEANKKMIKVKIKLVKTYYNHTSIIDFNLLIKQLYSTTSPSVVHHNDSNHTSSNRAGLLVPEKDKVARLDWLFMGSFLRDDAPPQVFYMRAKKTTSTGDFTEIIWSNSAPSCMKSRLNFLSKQMLSYRDTSAFQLKPIMDRVKHCCLSDFIRYIIGLLIRQNMASIRVQHLHATSMAVVSIFHTNGWAPAMIFHSLAIFMA